MTHSTNQLLARRAAAALADTATFVLGWGGAAIVILQFLVWRHPDNPWGSLALAIMVGFPLAAAILALWEGSTRKSAGRAATQLRLVSSSGIPLSKARQLVRGLLKWGTVVGLAVLASAVDSASLWTLTIPFLGYAALNALVCVDRPDGRSILDVVVGSRSVAVQ